MKSITDIAFECDVNRQSIHDAIRRLKIKPSKRNNQLLLNKQQEDLIHLNLYYLGKLTEITLESKINL